MRVPPSPRAATGSRSGRATRGADRGRQPQPDGLERLGEAEPELVRHAQEHARVAHEVARVDGHDPFGREEVVEGDRERPRIDPPGLGDLVERFVPPAPPPGDRPPDLVGAVPAGLAGRAAATASATWRTSPTTPKARVRCDPSASGSTSTWTTTASSAISRPCRIVHMFSVQPQPTTRSAPLISSAATGVANPPETSSAHGLPANRPFATADVASSAPLRSASRSRAVAAAGSAGARGRPRTPAARSPQRGGEPLPRPRRPPAPPAGRPAAGRRNPADLLGLHVQREVQQHDPPLPHRGGHRRGRLLHRLVRRRDPHRHRAHGRGQRRLVDVEVGARPGRLGRDHHQRCAALRGLGDAGHRVGQPAPLVHAQRRHPAGHPRVGVGHRGGAALVPCGHVPGPCGDHRVGDLEVARPHDTEDGADPAADEGLPDAVATFTARRAPAPASGSRSRRRSAAAPPPGPRHSAAAGPGSGVGSARTCRCP